MKWIYEAGLWLAATAMLAAMAFGAGQDSGPTKVEKIVNTTCMGCHELRVIQTQALDAAGWKRVVGSMIEKGAQVEKEDVPLLVSYLEENFGPLPEGPAKQIVLEKCTMCHDLKRVRQHFASPEEWAETLGAMENEGLMVNDEEYEALLRYLARNFRQ